MIDATELRKQVRVVLSTRPVDEAMSEPYILAALQRFFPEIVRADEMSVALQWNEAKGWIRSRWSEDMERTEWRLTEKGRVKEGL